MKVMEGQERIELHWWNFGHKTLDFSGRLSDCLQSKGIKFTKIKHKTATDVVGFRFKIEVSSRSITFDVFGITFAKAAVEALTIFLQLLGDKATIYCDHSTTKINF